ncbi:hypothetical protein F2P81_003148 [Scophthalmus maximus]|uniref:Uncharacterized protein n=1 Tax=Scophthalmus maximus TaxID=52904 RepID=A0A6A4TK24_SCOMX|nr:hypothetical protein F2P81_003148 [Scophthalmus maximus]
MGFSPEKPPDGGGGGDGSWTVNNSIMTLLKSIPSLTASQSDFSFSCPGNEGPESRTVQQQQQQQEEEEEEKRGQRSTAGSTERREEDVSQPAVEAPTPSFHNVSDNRCV